MSMIELGDPVKAELPPQTNRGGRVSNDPAYLAWLNKVPKDGASYELPSTAEDKAHPATRSSALRKVAKDNQLPIRIDVRAVTPGKRYRVFATYEKATPNGKVK